METMIDAFLENPVATAVGPATAATSRIGGKPVAAQAAVTLA